MVVDNIVETTCFRVGGFTSVDGAVELEGDIFAEVLRVRTCIGGDFGKLAIFLGQVMYALCCPKVSFVQATDEGEGTDEVCREVFGVVDVIGDGGLGIWIEGAIEDNTTVSIFIFRKHGHFWRFNATDAETDVEVENCRSSVDQEVVGTAMKGGIRIVVCL